MATSNLGKCQLPPVGPEMVGNGPYYGGSNVLKCQRFKIGHNDHNACVKLSMKWSGEDVFSATCHIACNDAVTDQRKTFHFCVNASRLIQKQEATSKFNHPKDDDDDLWIQETPLRMQPENSQS